MKEIRATKRHNLDQLLEEIEAGVSQLRPTGEGVNREAVMSVTGRGDDIVVLVPDETAEGVMEAVRGVIATHVARAPAPPPDLKGLWNAYKNGVLATALPQPVKNVLINDLGQLLRAMARGNRGDINGG